MRILLVAKPWRGGLATYVLEALRERFAHCVEFIPTYPESSASLASYRLHRRRWRNRLIQRINDASRQAAIFLNLPPNAARIEPRPGNVLWSTDAATGRSEDLAAFERVYVSDPGYGADMQAKAGGERFAGVLPFAMSPGLHRPARGDVTRDVCFIGSRDPKRDAHLKALLETQRRVTIVGNYFSRHALFWRSPRCFRPPVAIRDMGAVYARHKVSLNVHAQVVRGGTNMRTFECAGYGITQLVEHRPGLEALFTPDQEIATYSAPEELGEAVERLLVAPEHARALAQRARARALAEHTYSKRLQCLLADIV